MSKRIGDPQRRWVDRLRRQRAGAVMDKPAKKPTTPPPLGKPFATGVSPLDELRILYRYAGSTNVVRLYERMEELSAQLGYGRLYWVAVRELDAAPMGESLPSPEITDPNRDTSA